MSTCPIAFGRHGHNSHVRVSATRVSLKVWTVQSAGSPMAMGNQREYPNANFARTRRPVRLIVLAIARWSHVGLQRRGRAHTDNERRSLVWLQLGFHWHMGIYRAHSRPFNNRELQEFRMDPTHASQLLGICGT